ncbi:Ig-like domain-containing protein [candidate division KSB1 bacterium]|nr:Ig-like domain-containing protein [candidate division KSB1 bacterium]
MNKPFALCALLFLSIYFLMCASQGFPPGGPEDKSPPYIIRTFPATDTTNVPLDVQVIIEFSEAVNPISCQEVIFITPFAENVQYKWKRDRLLTIAFADSLLRDRTYIITIGAGARDRRNNAMKNSYTLAFSTGEILDKGRVSGHVYGDRVEGTQIWAYDLADTTDADPATKFPLYITQTGVDGAFALTHMALSEYRLFAVLDRDVNTVYNVGFDMIGVPTRDIVLDSTDFVLMNFNFRTAQQDTIKPMVSVASAPSNQQADIRFSESMLPDCLLVISNYRIESQNGVLAVLNAALDFDNSAVLHLTTARQDSGALYTVTVKQGYDLNYLPLHPDSNATAFQGSAIPDTAKPRYIGMLPPDSAKFVLSHTPLNFHFSKAMSGESVARHLVVADTLGDTIAGNITWPQLAHCVFTPTKEFARERLYFITLPVDSIFDMSGNALADTLFQRQFTSVNPDTLSAISGRVADEDTAASGPFFIRVRSVGEKSETSYWRWVSQPGQYQIEQMLPGSYVMEIYRDEDENGRFSYGSASPFQPAERFCVYPDTIDIRARWPNEGEDVLLHR